MKITRCSKESFAVIGKLGSTKDGNAFIQALWAAANQHFPEISHLAKRDAAGNIAGIWGAMSDFSLTFAPWENNFSEGLYLAGVECEADAQAPANWVKWIIPGYEYVCTEAEGSSTFSEVLHYLNERCLSLAGAVHDFTCPQTGTNYLYFPISKL